jgi:hypothetical protein
MKSKKKVFICNKGGHNYEQALKFGELVYVTEGNVNRFNTSNFYRAFIDAMEGSNKEDYILITSLSILNAIAAAVFARKHGRVNFLLFSHDDYTCREVDIDSLLDQEAILQSIKL